MNDKENSYYPLLTKGYGKSYITELLEEKDKKIEQLQSNWNILKQYIKEIPEEEFVNCEGYVNILDKMKELEGR